MFKEIKIWLVFFYRGTINFFINKKFLAYGIPIIFTAIFFSNFLPVPELVRYAKIYDIKKNIFKFQITANRTSKIFNEQAKDFPKQLSFFPVLQFLKVPDVLSDVEFCISHTPFIFDTEERSIPSDDKIIFNPSGHGEIVIDPKATHCFASGAMLSQGYRINSEETKERAMNWGIHFMNGEERAIFGYDLIWYRKVPTNPWLLVLMPYIIFTSWWGLLVLSLNIREKFTK
jgi:hypothetical protein